MKLIVFSDSHGRTAMMKRAAEAHFDDPDAAGIVHLGDGYEDLSLIDTRGLPVWRVRGNFEDHMYAFSSRRDEVPRELLFSLGGYNILIIHGHRFDVKSGYERAAAYAADRGADILMFGHTHVMTEKYLPAGTPVGTQLDTPLARPLYIFNPGTAGMGFVQSYGIVDLRPDGVVMSHAVSR